jgi:hypothetical protein
VVQHDLHQRHQGRRQPVLLPVALALALACTACGGDGGNAASPDVPRSILLVSGRDDHGTLVEPEVALGERPEGPAAAKLKDGTLVRVVATEGEWLRVRTLEGRVREGWINDYYLRGTVHLDCASPLGPSAQVELLDVDLGRVRVRALEGGRVAWVDRATLSERPIRCV